MNKINEYTFIVPNSFMYQVQWASKRLIYEKKKLNVAFLMVKPLQISTSKMALFLKWPIQHKWMKELGKTFLVQKMLL